MPRGKRCFPGGTVFHAPNRGNGRQTLTYLAHSTGGIVPVPFSPYVATLDAKLFALRDTGTSAAELRQTPLGEHGFAADLVGNANGILVSGLDLVLYSVSPSTGSIRWRHSLIDAAWIDGRRHQADVYAGQYQTSPVVVGDVVYIGGPDGFLNAHDADSGERLWRFEARG